MSENTSPENKNPRKGGNQRQSKLLTHKQELFVAAFLTNGFRPKAAALAAGVEESQASSLGCQWLNESRFPQISAEIDRVVAERRANHEVTAEQLIREYARIGFMDPRRLFDPVTGRLFTARELPDDVAPAVRRIRLRWEDGVDEDGEPVTYRVADIEFHDKQHALDQLARHLGVCQPKDGTQVNVQVQQAIINWVETIPGLNGGKLPGPDAYTLKMQELRAKLEEEKKQPPRIAAAEVHKNGHNQTGDANGKR